MPPSSFLLDDVGCGQLGVPLECAPRMRCDKRAQKISDITTRFSILEQNQEWHRQRWDHKLHEDVERDPEHMRIAAYEVRKQVHCRSECEHQDQVLELQAQERHLGVEVAVNRRHIETHCPTLQLRAP